jgi:glutamate-1-semialdehyde 2,1-aminomutase
MTMSRKRSAELMQRAERVLVGGVNSPVRAFKAVGGSPPFIASGQGATIRDEDGNEYVDYVGSWGPLIAGHCHPAVVEAIARAASRGSSFGAPTEAEIVLAELVAERVPGVERVRFVNSGTEATMSALRLARAASGRDHIVKLAGCYHGHSDALLVKAGSGVTTLGLPDSPGVPAAFAALTHSCELNELGSVRQAFEAYPGEIGAVILEPVAGNMGVVPPQPGFLQGLLELTHEQGALLVFDEVMTGFRLQRGGAAQLFGITPDLYCFGKVIGGGLPVGAYAGPAHLMDRIAPAGPVYQAGTLSGNPLAMAAGTATLRLLEPAAYERLEQLGARLETGLQEAGRAAGVELCVQRVGSMLTPFFQPGPVRGFTEALSSDTARFRDFHAGMLERGHYLPASQYEAWFLSLAHGEPDIDRTVEAAAEVLRTLAR